MKNKLGLTAVTLLAALSLAACANNGNQSSSQPQKQSSSKVQKTESSSKENSSSKESSSQAPKQSRIDSLTAKLHKVLPNMLLPTKDGLGQGSENLNARYTTASDKDVVYYIVGNSPVAFNAASLQNEKPYAVLTEYKNVSDADSIINYMPAQTGLPTVKLDANTTATSEGAAGQKYLQWNKGKWSYVVQASSVLKQDGTKKAKELLNLVNEFGMPATTTNSSVHVIVGDSVGSLNTVISWQNGNNVYQLKAHDTETAFKMLSSLQ